MYIGVKFKLSVFLYQTGRGVLVIVIYAGCGVRCLNGMTPSYGCGFAYVNVRTSHAVCLTHLSPPDSFEPA